MRGPAGGVVCALIALALGCRAPEESITVSLRIERESLRPEYVELWWTAPGGRERRDIRVPHAGALDVRGAVLATVVVDVAGARPGERKAVAWGMRGGEQISGAAGTVSWTPGQSTGLVLVLSCAQDLVKSGVLPAAGPGQFARGPCAPEPVSTDAGEPRRDDAAPRRDDAAPAPPPDAPPRPPPDAAPDAPPRDASPPPPDAEVRADRPPPPPPPNVNLTAGVVAYFRLDDGAGVQFPRDSSPSGSVAVLNQLDSVRAWVPGVYGTALEIGGRGWMEVVGEALNKISVGLTISAFVNRTGDGTIISRRAVGARGFLYRLNIAGDLLAASINSSNGARAELTSSRPVPLRQWVHVAAVYDRMTLRLFIDGQNVGQQVYELAISPENSPLFVGAGQAVSGGEDALFGSIDEVLLYDRALSVPEIAALASGFVPKLP